MDRRGAIKLLAGGSASALAFAQAPAAFAAAGPLYRDARAPIPSRVADLLARMTLPEKIAQLRAAWAQKADMIEGLEFDPAKASAAFPDGIGHVTRPSDKRGVPGITGAAGGTAARWRTPKQTVDFINALQRWALEDTRLGIPVLLHEESLHGYMATEATMFPQAIALAGSFDTDLMRRVQAVIAREVRARGVPLVLSPVVDIVRDPRWGRIEETWGEDPYLCAEMGVAAVEGLQGPGKFDRLAPGKVFATLKHMTGHGQPESGNNVSPAQTARRDLRENFFKPFHEVVRRTSIGAVMPSYNEIDGIPSHASTWLLGDVLRGEWGFDGLIVSDYGGVHELATLHHVARDEADAALQALEAGVDSELPDGQAYATLADGVAADRVPVELIDRACARMLTFKMRAGLFENPYGDAALAERITGNAEARALALEAARKGLCLLKNENDTLPLDPARMGRVAVIGPNHAIARLGGYSSVPKQTVSLIEGLRALAPDADFTTAQGVFITTSEDRSVDEVELADPARNRELIAEAVAVARAADAIVLAIGDTEQTSREGFAKNHLGDRTDLDLVGEQNELVDALTALGKPLVIAAINGRPPSWPNAVAKADAILECWYPGQEGGTAMAEALLGRINPGSKLPVTVVRDAGQVPFYYDHKPSARRGYLFDDKAPLFPFGHGLSYTTFSVSAPRPSRETYASTQAIEVEVEVENTGERGGDEVVQLYVTREDLPITQPVLELKGFQRVTLAAGESRTLRFAIEPRQLAIWDREMNEVNLPGPAILSAGNSSANLKTARVEIL
ncbi:glycoside hydrolase family 3 C-terminal domain-containing protein [Erythrobacter sp. LQ02-29]|uniref:glycoside hydrolase family 3 N-terminal domain-containing protein n=1 Tax=Erythrobacter sp. LQ02-29 TaxID=2920384 RepID=UPI001F4EF39D|nr:glycoside hydrolase family 3 N-terminal domain-containing protein [Erythrobacter sp. LQ02-29]MCP9223546.1 glycoside hydrolase family 3 C-terminal domain-containing protein [Erythrobacter sp. LQ02-29]